MSTVPRKSGSANEAPKRRLKWARSNDGFCDSKCKRYKITPLYCGCVKPQFFELWFYPKGFGEDGFRGERVKVSSMSSSQREAKEDAERHAERNS